ncbi:sugar ABC transporter permease [Allokutzneria sp. A3M-2-11 16]|uniref:carbohydrate ABC transporter permease n=1 Tax=Allokutzneria sp. A3M-2-11 16 TaxID=2962043 RepID=UPI0020B8F74F|nr:sugar ABC transporter permease [Allokutzneria sp. A3M-2-11 16]MCP3804110.1 sugar ABC transporter permease [Allokutzneria sp. A3M-2-11 16]
MNAQTRRERIAAALFLAPDMVGLLVFLVLPMLLSLVLAFFQVDGFGGIEFVGLDNYARMIDDPQFWVSLRVTLAYVVFLVPLLFGTSLGLALLVRQKIPAVGVFRTAFFLPYMVSVVVVGLLWRYMLGDDIGIVPSALSGLGVPAPSFLGDPAYALGTVVAITVWVSAGYYMVIFLAGLQDIPREYYEAARLDGAGPVRSFRAVTWPLLKPTSFFVLLTSTIAAVTGGFDLVFVLTNGGPANSTSLLVFYVYQQAFQFGEFGYASALSSVLVLVLLVWSLLLFRITKAGKFSYDDA